MATSYQRLDAAEMEDSDDEPTEDFIPGMHKVKNEKSELTQLQSEEHGKILKVLEKEYAAQEGIDVNTDVLRFREQFLHIHGTQGGERALDAVVVMKAVQMLDQGLQVCVLNLDFLRRLRTRALYFFLKDYAMITSENRVKCRHKIYLKIQEEVPDDVDRETLVEELNFLTEDWPLFVITDESCKEAERIDDGINTYLTKERQHFHFWSTSTFAHGTPDKAGRQRLAPNRSFPFPIKQLVDMIDIDDDNTNIYSHHNPPIRRVNYPLPDDDPDFNIREHLDWLNTFLIGHDKTHLEPDVWECEQCGTQLGNYLNNYIGLGKPGLNNNEVFIVGHLKRFESIVTVSGLEKSLLSCGIESEAPFCRRAVRIQDILQTMRRVVVADSISMRGVDKQIVIIIPNPRDPKLQKNVEQEAREAEFAASIPDDGVPFQKPKVDHEDDETVLYLRPLRSGDSMDGIQDYVWLRKKEGGTDAEGLPTHEDLSEDEFQDDNPWELHKGMASDHSKLRRAINSMSQEDKDMILDVLTDAPCHTVLFHFAQDEHFIY